MANHISPDPRIGGKLKVVNVLQSAGPAKGSGGGLRAERVLSAAPDQFSRLLAADKPRKVGCAVQIVADERRLCVAPQGLQSLFYIEVEVLADLLSHAVP